MARKDPFKRVSVSDRIYEAVDKRRLEESKDDFRPLPMNAYCEKILWDYAQGKLTRGESGSAQERGVLDLLEVDPKLLTEDQRKQIALYLGELNDRLSDAERSAHPRHKKTG